MSDGLIQVAVKKPGLAIEFVHVANQLEVFQNLVGGYVEQVHLGRWSSGLVMLCNENGKIENLPPNFMMGDDCVVGTVAFMNLFDHQGEMNGEWNSINSSDTAFLKMAFADRK